MAKYVLTTEFGEKKGDSRFWSCPTLQSKARLFDSFNEAKTAMRREIVKLVHECDYFPIDYENGSYIPLWEYIDEDSYFPDWMREDHVESGDAAEPEEIKAFYQMVCGILNDADYQPQGVDDLDFEDVDTADSYFAFTADPEQICVDSYGPYYFKTNVHNMNDDGKRYYFSFFEADEESETERLNEINIRLFPIDEE